MDFIKTNAKAVATFVLTIVLQAITDVAAGTAGVDIFDWKGILRYLGLSLLAGTVVWATGNKLDVGQILAGTKKLSVPQQAEVAKGALTELPNAISDRVVKNYPHWVTG